jgi:beta-glucosidase
LSDIDQHPGDVSPFDRAVLAVRSGESARHKAKQLYDQLTLDERLGLLDGDTPFWQGMDSMITEGYNHKPYVHGAVARLGIPGTRFVDGPRGCVAGRGTAFPVSMARGATWDTDLEEQVGEVIGREIRAQGGNFFGGVCVNLPRHPAWGRIQETYGDDPFHLGEFGAALVRGSQRYVMACGKHYALNSMENARFTVDVTLDEATLHDVYLPHFKRLVDEGVTAIMASYNSVNGEWAGQNEYLLTRVLRELWGFDGITVTDFIWGMRDGAKALNAGMDLEEPFAQQRATHLRAQLASGETSLEMVERAAIRILTAQLRSYATREDGEFDDTTMADDSARRLARTVAARSMVLLKNDPVAGAPVLPLAPASVTSIAVIGRLAVATNLGDHGSSDVRPSRISTPLQGIRAAFPDATITLVTDEDPVAAAATAHAAQVAIVIAGFDARDEGEYVGSDTLSNPALLALFPPRPAGPAFSSETESRAETGDVPNIMTEGDEYGGDRATLSLRPREEEIIRAVAAANPRTAVCLVAAGAVLTETWRHEVPAIVMMWYAGMAGGHALADVLTGAHNPSGRLPFAIPTTQEHLPFFDRTATTAVYDRFHGQRLLDRLGVTPAFPHGFGLSYTTFSIDEVSLSTPDADGVTVKARVTNTGDRSGWHVVQVYGIRSDGRYAGERFLVGFAPVEVPAGASVLVAVAASFSPLAEWDPTTGRRVLPLPHAVTLRVGAHAGDDRAVVVAVQP